MQPIHHIFLLLFRFSTITFIQGKPNANNVVQFKVLNNVNFILTELSGAHCKNPEQEQEQLSR